MKARGPLSSIERQQAAEEAPTQLIKAQRLMLLQTTRHNRASIWESKFAIILVLGINLGRANKSAKPWF